MTNSTFDLSVNLQETEAALELENFGVIVEFESIEGFVGNTATQNSFTGLNAEGVWSLTADKIGNVDYAGTRFDFTNFDTLIGGTAQDTFFLDGYAVGSVQSLANAPDVRDTLNAGTTAGFENAWQITGDRAGTLQRVTRDADGSITNGDTAQTTAFSGIDVITGSNVVDTFTFETAGRMFAVRALGESDTLQLADQGNTILLSGDEGEDMSQGQIVLTANPADVILSEFYNVELIRGGNAVDAVSVAVANADFDANLQTGFVNFNNLAFESIEGFIANVDRNNTFTGLDVSGEWTLTNDRTGRVVYGTGDTAQTFTFENFDVLFGGAETDNFDLAGFAVNEINGRGGMNALTAGARFMSGGSTTFENDWLIETDGQGVLSRVTRDVDGTINVNQTTAFTGMFDLTGGNTRDQFTLQDSGVIQGVIDGAGGIEDELIIQRGQQYWFADGLVANRLTPDQAHTRFAGIESLVGAGDDLLQGTNNTSVWTVSEPGQGTLNYTDDSVKNLSFSGFSALIGGSEQDDFTVDDVNYIAEFIDGGETSADATINDSVLITQGTAFSVLLDRNEGQEPVADQLNLANINTVTAQTGQGNTLIGSSLDAAGYTWTIDEDRNGTVVGNSDASSTRFINFALVQGGIQSDDFVLSGGGNVTAVDGGQGVDSVDVSAVTRDTLLAIESDVPSGLRVDAVETLVGNNDGGADAMFQSTLSTDTGDNVWLVDGLNDGVFSREGSAGQGAIRFENFNHLNGGDGGDRFAVTGDAFVSGVLLGNDNLGDSEDLLDLSGATIQNTVALIDEQSLASLGYTALRTSQQQVEGAFLTTGLESVRGNGSQTTLVGSRIATTWDMAGINQGELSFGTETVAFANVHNLTGRDAIDIFNFDENDVLSGWLSGGAGSDTVNFDPTADSASVALADAAQITLQANVLVNVRDDVELLSAAGDKDFLLIANTTVNNAWLLNGEDAGELNGVEYTGFDRLLGGVNNDVFTVVDGASQSGLIDGGAGENSVNASTFSTALSASLGLRDGVDLQLENIDSIAGNSATEDLNILYGRVLAPNAVRITNVNTGVLNDTLDFSQFGNVTGGSEDDVFAFEGDGALTGLVDGQGHVVGDTVDYSLVDRQLDIAVDGSGGVANIEILIGNEQLRLIGSNTENTWRLFEGVNQGEVEYDNGQILRFSRVNNLVGGNLTDTFILNGGQIDGTINGGAGDDSLNYVVLTEDVPETRATVFVGGIGNDSVNISGGAADFTGNFRASRVVMEDGVSILVRDSLAFTSPSLGDAEQIVRYSEVDEVNQRATTGEFIVNGTEDADVFALATSEFSVNDSVAVTYDNNTPNLTLNAGTTDTIQVNENVQLSGTLSLFNGIVEAVAGAQIQAGTLVLDNVRNVGDAAAPLQTSITNLVMRDLSGDVFIREENTLTLGETNVAGNVNLLVETGDLNQSQVVIAAGVLSLETLNGDIVLDQSANDIIARLNLSTTEQATIVNASSTELGDVTVGSLVIDSENSISDTGVVTVNGDTNLSTRGDITLDNAENDFASVSIGEAVNATLVDANALRLDNASASGNVTLMSNDLSLVGMISALSLTGTAAEDVSIEGSSVVNIVENISLTGAAVDANGNVQAEDIVLDATMGTVNVSGVVASTNSTTLRGNDVNLLNTVGTTGDLVIAATGNVNQAQAVEVGGTYTVEGTAQNLSLSTVNANTMNVSAQNLVEQKGNISTVQDAVIVAGQFVADTTANIDASEGSVSITSVSDLNSGVITAGSDVLLRSTEGVLVVASAIEAGNQAQIDGASSLQLNSTVFGNNGVAFGSGGNATLNGVLRSENGTVAGDVTGDIVMTANALVESITGNIDLSTTEGDILLTQLRAVDGSVSLNVGGAVVDNDLDGLEEPVNIDAITLNSNSVDGFGSLENPIETSVFQVNMTNRMGRIDLVNVGKTLNVSALLSNGDIRLENEFSAFFPAGAVNTFYDPEVPLNPNTGNVPQPGGTFTFRVQDRGGLVVLGPIDINNPNISAVSTNILTPTGFFGGPGVPPVIYTEEDLIITASTILNEPIFGFGRRPANEPEFNSSTPDTLNEIGASEQIVQVESLEQVDPAIFTSINNYFYQDVSILLPEDQRYDELEDDEEEI